MKWIKRLLLYPLAVFILLVTVFFLFNKDFYFTLKGFFGSELQWYGYNEEGSAVIEKCIAKMDKINASTYHAFSVQNTKNGNYDEAIRYLNKAVDLDPINGDGYFGWSLLYYYRDYEKALFHLERLDSSTQFVDYVGDDNILYAKGLCWKQLGYYDKALSLFEQSIEHERKEHSESWITHQMYFQTGRALHNLDRLEEAIDYYNQAIENWDGSSESYYYKGLAELELGIDSGCDNLKVALHKVEKGIKSSDFYVRLFDEIYPDQVNETIAKKCPE